jgi:hypothetical protein
MWLSLQGTIRVKVRNFKRENEKQVEGSGSPTSFITLHPPIYMPIKKIRNNERTMLITRPPGL